MATKNDKTLIYVTIGAALLLWWWKKKPITMPLITPAANPPIVQATPGIPSGGALTTPGGKVIEAGYDPSVYSAPVMKDNPPDIARDYAPGGFDPGPVDMAPVDPVYLTDYAINSNDSGTPAPPYSYPQDIFQDDIFYSPAPTDPFSVNTLPSTGLQQLTPSYATIKDTNPYQPTLDYDCPGCTKSNLSGFRPVPNIC